MTEFLESIVTLHTQSAHQAFHIILISLIPRLEVGQGQSQGQCQVKKGHYIQKSHSGHVIHVLWPILAIEFDGQLVWSFEATFRSFQRSSGQGQVKKVKFSKL